MAQNQAYLFIVFSLTGVIIGILFDIFRILRRTFKTNNIITYIEDILFWILTGILILYNIWYFNNGEIRIFMFLGIIMGILIYISTLSSILIKIFTKILLTLKNIIILPIRKIFTNINHFFAIFVKKNKTKRGNLEKNGE